MTHERARHGESFNDIARNIAEVVDDLMNAERDRARRIELITHSVRRAMSHAYRAGKGQFSKPAAPDSGDR
jgi:broad specificity phosphatase PhoE